MFKKSSLSVSILLALSPYATAQEPITFDEVVVTATRTNGQLEDTAATVTVIDGETIEEDMISGLDDLFEYTPGVSVQTDSRQGVKNINIRGVEGNRIKVLVDGVAQGNEYDSGMQFINSSRAEVDVDLLKAVEVVKGAASSLHGSDAIGGIVAFETKDPKDLLKGREQGGFAKVNYASEDRTFSETVALANQIGEVETLVAFTRRDGEQLRNFGETDEQDNTVNNLLFKLQYQLNQAHRLEFSGNYYTNDSETTLPDAMVFGSRYTQVAGNDETTQYQLGLKHIWDVEAALADSVSWQVDLLTKDENNLTSRYNATTGNQQRKDYEYSDKGYHVDIQADKVLSTEHVEHYVIYGASLADKDIRNVNNEYNSLAADKLFFYMPEASEFRYGLFLQNEMTFGNWIVTPGIRYDSFETKPGDASQNTSGISQDDYKTFSDSALTARLGTVYKLNESHRIFAQISQGFRAPDFQELYYSFGNPASGYVFTPNPDLKAEESLSYELGWRHKGEASSNEVALYYSDYDNFIEQDRVSGTFGNPFDPATFQYINIGKATIKGVEFSNTLSWDAFMPHSGFSSRVAAAYTEGKDGEGNPLNTVNPWNMVVGVNYDAADNWGTALNVSYTAPKRKSDINGEDIEPISSATVVNLTAYYKPMEDLTLRAGVFNLTNEEYYNWNNVRSQTEMDKDLSQAKRNWAITARYDF